jgi:hypothetical protein
MQTAVIAFALVLPEAAATIRRSFPDIPLPGSYILSHSWPDVHILLTPLPKGGRISQA